MTDHLPAPRRVVPDEVINLVPGPAVPLADGLRRPINSGRDTEADRAAADPLSQAGPIARAEWNRQQAAASAAVSAVLNQIGGEFGTAGDLAAVMTALPADTPIRVAECMQVDPDLTPGAATVTATAARAITLPDPHPVDVDETDDRIKQYARVVPAVELRAVVVADGSPIPAETIPWPAHEQALHAVGLGDVGTALHALAGLLSEVADLVTHRRGDPHDGPQTVASWIPRTSADLRAQLSIEAEYLRRIAGRLTGIRQVAELRGNRQATEDAADTRPELR
jgi:hypothetical protein